MSLYWLSFADPDLPKGEQFLGVVVVEADGFEGAVYSTWKLRINPGGEIRGHEISYSKECVREIPNEYIGRLLTKDEAEKLERICLGEESP